jgi:tRNA nucleotidyltransferase (CCA-adding enzyme)
MRVANYGRLTASELEFEKTGYNSFMRIILTHEQADFDALASLLAGFLLDEYALPVLPHRMNRNVRAFVTIYGMELPFIEQRDLPSELVETVCLVDTQSMITVKGISSDTQVHIVDHHPRRDDLPKNWKVTSDQTGATTTILVERLEEQDGGLSVVFATLLLLGIYEDTGSLTYSRTTARDLKAAAYLVEQGANLRIAADFLNHPLSADQQKLSDQLRSGAMSVKIHGHNVIIAAGNAQDLDEELSSVAHKLRDLLDPDALFVVVTTKSGVQIIARSTSEQVDVAQVVAHFGGGGHDRAAAALVRESPLEEVLSELEKVLPEMIYPAITVAQIMSSGPQILAPETPVAEAARRMQRYGYEGYPVVKDGKILGLLTRRAVDRAMSHRLNVAVSSLMDAGEVTISPDDSIENLQRLMVDTGWGQIPVVHPESGEIIGIVTRTDLLKTLTSPASLTYRRNLAELLEKMMPTDHLALLRTVAQLASEQHLPVYIVGGFVRDLLLDRPSLDFDIVVEGDAIGLAQSLQKKFGGRVTTHHRFGTAKWYLDGYLSLQNRSLLHSDPSNPELSGNLPPFLDLISARTEFYTYPSALPTVETGSIKLDLHRRDFTINTLALRLDGFHYGDLHDYWGGLTDLRQGLVRVLHSLSFVDDPTRMVRAVRFEKRFGFKIEERTLELMQEALSLLDRVSGDRIRHELDRVLDEDNLIEIFSRLNELGLIFAIHPDLMWDDWLRQRLSQVPQQPPGLDWGFDENTQPPGSWKNLRRLLAYILWLIRLHPDRIQLVSARLKISHSHVEEILAASHLYQDLPALAPLPPSAIVDRLGEVPLISVYASCLAASEVEPCELLSTYLTSWRHVTPTVNGADLKKRGILPGPIYKKILGTLRSAWLDGFISTGEQEKALLEQLLQDEPL